ncbi:MAG: hypothetical protein J6M02_00350 [Clostridia bacterium]|nr:hypothetical protein [Clostridia bacterium]
METWNITGESGTTYVTPKCTHPGIYMKEINGKPQLCCDEASGNKIVYVKGEHEEHPSCGKCGTLLFPSRIKPRLR